MRNRPWALVLLAWLQILTPAFNVLLNAWILQVTPDLVLNWWMQRPAIQIFECFFLMPLAGIAIFLMRRWSYLAFFLALAWNLFANIRYVEYVFSSMPMLLSLAYAVGNLALVTYILLPSVRRAYFDPSVRWWESQPRLELATEARLVVDGHLLKADLLNLSEGGAFVKAEKNLPPEANLELSFRILSREFQVTGEVRHVRDDHAGIRFLHTRQSARQFQNLVKGLELIGISESRSRLCFFRAWSEDLLRFLKTGKGLLPEFRTSRPTQK